MQSIKQFQSYAHEPVVPATDDPIMSKKIEGINQGEEVECDLNGSNQPVSHSTNSSNDASCIVVSTGASSDVSSYYTFDAVNTSKSCDLRPLPGNLPLLLQLLLCPL